MKSLNIDRFSQLFPEEKAPLVFGHRGCSIDFPENTLPAFMDALESSISGVELDLHLTTDGELVIIHDYNTKRTTGIDLEVENSSLSELKKLNAGFYFKKKTIEAQIPTLDELFSMAGKGFYYDLEIKERSHRKDILSFIEKLAKKYQLWDRVIISSFNPWIVRDAVKLGFKKTAIIYSKKREVPWYLRRGQGRIISGCNILKPRKDLAQKVAKKFSNKYAIFTWTVDEPGLAKGLIESGVSGICSNQPKLFID